MMPALSRAAVLVSPGTPPHPAVLKSVQAAARQIGVEVLPVNACIPEVIEYLIYVPQSPPPTPRLWVLCQVDDLIQPRQHFGKWQVGQPFKRARSGSPQTPLE